MKEKILNIISIIAGILLMLSLLVTFYLYNTGRAIKEKEEYIKEHQKMCRGLCSYATPETYNQCVMYCLDSIK